MPVYRPPLWSYEQRRHIDKVARDYAQAHKSDPFTFKRIRHYMLCGIELPSDIASVAEGILNARGAKHD